MISGLYATPIKTRIDAPGALHHIIAGGRERKKIIRETFAKRHFLSNFCVPDERDLRFASTGRNTFSISRIYPPLEDYSLSLSKRSVDPTYRGPVGLADRTGVVKPDLKLGRLP